MRHRRRLALVSMAAGAAVAAFGAPALAADPGGANGTVKIDGPEYQPDNRNEPHVTCKFQVEFFNFDKDERASLIFEAQPPSAADFHEVGRLDDVVVSTDPATGGAYTRDPDNVFVDGKDFTLDLTEADAHPKQGYHIKLTIDRQNHPGWTEKHKVFWLKPCDDNGGDDGGDDGNGGDDGDDGGDDGNGGDDNNGGGGNGGGGGDNGDDNGGGLPVTGAAATTMALTGVGLVGGGAALMWLRRRRDDVTFTS